MNSYEAERKAASELKDILGWSEDPLNDLVPVCMALCDKIDKLEREVARLRAAKAEGGES
jgi:hypothetical protein